ncbi:hypothetical protein NXS19_001615, partial [Fusarium pseudograminearum]
MERGISALQGPLQTLGRAGRGIQHPAGHSAQPSFVSLNLRSFLFISSCATTIRPFIPSTSLRRPATPNM